jgi:CW-type Zinc Finger
MGGLEVGESMAQAGAGEQRLSAQNTVVTADDWVQCDRCGKWRRVSEALAEALDDDANWFCEDNPDARHASCAVPQEMTDAEIDRGGIAASLELERLRRTRRPAVWQLIRCAPALAPAQCCGACVLRKQVK